MALDHIVEVFPLDGTSASPARAEPRPVARAATVSKKPIQPKLKQAVRTI